MSLLLDINVLIARVDPNHEFHAAARSWLKSHADSPIATCPITENGFLRIYGHPGYPGGPGSLENALLDLRAIRARPGHEFLADSLSIADPTRFSSLDGVRSKTLTDIYLLALAATRGHHFVTFDRAIPAALVPGGTNALQVIETN